MSFRVGGVHIRQMNLAVSGRLGMRAIPWFEQILVVQAVFVCALTVHNGLFSKYRKKNARRILLSFFLGKCDTGNHRIQHCDAEGSCSSFGAFGADPGEFNLSCLSQEFC